MRTEHFRFYILYLLIIATLLTHSSSLSQAVRMCAYVLYVLTRTTTSARTKSSSFLPPRREGLRFARPNNACM